MRFLYNMLDAGNCPINPHPLEVEAKSLGHALQKIAASLFDDCVEVQAWQSPSAQPSSDRVLQFKAKGATRSKR